LPAVGDPQIEHFDHHKPDFGPDNPDWPAFNAPINDMGRSSSVRRAATFRAARCGTRLGQELATRYRRFRLAKRKKQILFLLMSPDAHVRDRYLVKSIVHSSQLLTAFRSSGEALPLKEIVARCGLPKTMAFRLLYTLEKCGMIEKLGANLYQSSFRPLKQRLCRLGYAAQGTDYQFSREVTSSLERAAQAEQKLADLRDG